jgi:hypothetical protein
VSPAAATTFSVAGYPSPRTANSPAPFTVTALDAYGNVATGYTGTVHVTSSDPIAVLPADYTFTATDAGVHVFRANLVQAGAHSLTVTDTATPTLTGSQTGITVTPAAPTWFIITASPSAQAGVPVTITVTVLDDFDNIVTGYTGTIHFTSTDAAAVLPADYTFGSSDNGKATFQATFWMPGTQNVTVTDVNDSWVTGSTQVSL